MSEPITAEMVVRALATAANRPIEAAGLYHNNVAAELNRLLAEREAPRPRRLTFTEWLVQDPVRKREWWRGSDTVATRLLADYLDEIAREGW